MNYSRFSGRRKSCGDQVRSAREKKGASIEEAAGELGCTTLQLERIECGDGRIPKALVTKIVDYLGVSRTRLNGNIAELGDHLRNHRKLTGISLRDASERTGLSRTYISQIECGYTLPLEGTVRKISKGLGLEFYEMMRLAGLVTDDMLKYIMRKENYFKIMREVVEKGTKPCLTNIPQCTK